MPTLNWIGKDAVVNHHMKVPFRLLKDVPDLACGDSGSGNLIVQGDNLEALKALLPYYAGQVKCIYIDPPYNTGNEGWAYNDNVNSPIIRDWLGKVVGKEGETLDRHDRWLCMMYPRLALLRQFLRDDGTIFVSLDDNEAALCRLLMNEIFGSHNFIATIAWQRRISPDARLGLSQAHDHILVFGKQLDKVSFNRVPVNPEQEKNFKNPDDDKRGPWVSTDFTAPGWRPNQMYTLKSPGGITFEPPPGRCWKNIESEFTRLLGEERMWFGKDGKARPRVKTYLSETEGVSTWTWWPHTEAGHNQEAKQEINSILCHEVPFDTPKPTRLIERILQIATNPGDLVMDSFAGSGTTGHAVLKMNAANTVRAETAKNAEEDSLFKTSADSASSVRNFSMNAENSVRAENTEGAEVKTLLETSAVSAVSARNLPPNRRFILVEMEPKIAREVTAERVRRVAEGYTNAKGVSVEGLGGGFRYCELGEPLFDETGMIRETVKFSELARHVFFSETGEPLPRARVLNTPLIGEYNGVGIYLLYNGILGDDSVNGGNVLTRQILAKLPPFDGPKVIYCAGCLLSRDRLQAERITIRQTPYEIKVS